VAAATQSGEMARTGEIVQGQFAICHGAEGRSSTPLFPSLAGPHAAYLENWLRAFLARERTNDNEVMQTITSRIGDSAPKAMSCSLSGLSRLKCARRKRRCATRVGAAQRRPAPEEGSLRLRACRPRCSRPS
jgi:cytochrome c553